MKDEQTQIKNIILVDDDADDREFFADALSEIKIGKKLTTLNDGVFLMETLIENVPPAPDVIFLDLNMPRKNGFECLEEIRQTPKLKDIPIVILSTSSSVDVIEKTYNQGAHYYICKPNSVAQLKKMIETVLAFDLKQNAKQPKRDSFVLSLSL